jgi:phage baseplate assembly protein W
MAHPLSQHSHPGGWAFPPSFDRTNHTVNISSGTANISENLRILFATDPGERSLLPAYGTPLLKYLFTSLNSTLQNEIKRDIRDAIIRWEPRITVISIEVSQPQAALESLQIVICFQEKQTGDQGTMSLLVDLQGPSAASTGRAD